MSFLSELRDKKTKLKNCQTIITSISGSKHIENRNNNGQIEITKLQEKCLGFVVNDKPDLQIAEILPYLYLSSQDVAQDVDLLNKNGITHVLSVGVDVPKIEKIIFTKIELLDEPNSDITDALSVSFEFIEKTRLENENNKILVHCNAGYSRAPTIVIGYLIKKFGYSLNESFKIVNEKRNIKPNDGFLKQLRMLEKQNTVL